MSGGDVELNLEEFATNPTPRVPIALVLDTSGSMEGEPIQELNEGLKLFIEELKEDEIARSSAEVAIFTFGGNVVVVQDFTPIDKIEPVELTAGGETPMGTAVNTALDYLETRKRIYKELGIDYFQPWLVLMTDECPRTQLAARSSACRPC